MDVGLELRRVMGEQGMTQSGLSRITGIPQGRISEYMSGKRTPGETTLELLFGSMGLRPRTVLLVDPEPMGHSERRSWLLHRQLSTHLDDFDSWLDKLKSNLDLVEHSVSGEPHQSNLQRWRQLVEQRDVRGVRRVMVDPSRDGQQMREVGPFTGLLPNDERLQVLRTLSRR